MPDYAVFSLNSADLNIFLAFFKHILTNLLLFGLLAHDSCVSTHFLVDEESTGDIWNTLGITGLPDYAVFSRNLEVCCIFSAVLIIFSTIYHCFDLWTMILVAIPMFWGMRNLIATFRTL